MKIVKTALIMFALACFLGGEAFAGGALPKPESENPEAQKLIDQAWELYRSGSNPETYQKCIELMERSNELDPNNTSILTDLSRYYWNLGDNLPKETEEQQEHLQELYTKGQKYAEQALGIKETVGDHYWYAVNKAAYNEFNSIFSQAAAFPSIKGHSDYVTEHDEDYYYGASGRLWSEILVRVPKVVVKIVGWNVQDAVDDIDGSIKKYPDYFDNYVYKARFIYTYFENKEEALELLDTVLKKSPDSLPGEVQANKTSQKDARELWKKITGKEYPER